MQRREEAIAAALWAFVERVREREPAVLRGADGLTPAEVQELAALLDTAWQLPAALDGADEWNAGAAEERVRSAIALRAHAREPAARRALHWLPRAWTPTLRAACVASVALVALAGGFAAGRHLSHQERRPVPPGPIQAAMSCREARAHFAALLQNRLPEVEARTVLRHLARCPSCYRAFVAFRSTHHDDRGAVPAGWRRVAMR